LGILKSTKNEVIMAKVESENALNIFTSTIAKLVKANDRLVKASETDRTQIEILEENRNQADQQLGKNEKLIYKINEIIGG